MMAHEKYKSVRENFGKFIHQLNWNQDTYQEFNLIKYLN